MKMSIGKLNCLSKKLSLAIGIAATALFVVIPTSSQAALFIDERANIQSNDQVDWSSL